MAGTTNVGLSGASIDCSDPCISGAPLGMPFLLLPPSGTPDLLIRTQVSTPCQASDWQSLCDTCSGGGSVTDNGDGTVTIVGGDSATLGLLANRVTVGNETASNVPALPATPATPPAAPNVDNDIHIEVYADAIVYWRRSGVSWVLAAQFSGGGGATAGDMPFRIAGADTGVGTGGATQPTSADSVPVVNNVQHIGRVLLGGAVGDNPVSQLHVEGDAFLRNSGVQVPFLTTVNDQGVANEHRFVFAHRAPDNVDFAHVRISPTSDIGAITAAGTAFDRFGNLINNHGIKFNTNGARQNIVWRDGVGVNQSVAPSAPWDTTTVHTWSIGGELFVMDGAGNTTQLSSHSEAIAELLDIPGDGYNINSYNVFTGVGEGRDPITGRSVLYDIDTGDYTLDDGSKGTDERLALGRNHAKVKGGRGSKFWNAWQRELHSDERSAERQKMPSRLKKQIQRFELAKDANTSDAAKAQQ